MSFINNLQWRYSTKKFDISKKISEEDKKKVLEAIRMSPSSFGYQPFHILIVESKEVREELKKAAYNQAQITDASLLLVFSVRKDLAKRVDEYIEMVSGGDSSKKESLKKYEDMTKGAASMFDEKGAEAWAAKQTYIALGFALAACADLELDSCPMEGFDANAFDKILKLPDNLYTHAALAIGYRVNDKDIKPKNRFPERDIFEVK